MSILQEKFKEIADKIRMYIGSADLIKPSEFASKIDEVFNSGEKFGRSNGIEEARQIFWRAFQREGLRTNYQYAFQRGWTEYTFKPLFDMKPTGQNGANNMFGSGDSSGLDLRTSAIGITIDFSGCTSFNNTFSYSPAVVAIGTIDTRKATSLSNMFNSATQLHTVEKLILKDDGSQTTMDMSNASKLANITVQGVIGDNINFKSSPLTRASIESIFGCLSATATRKTLTLKSGLVDTAFETTEGAADGRQVFEDLIATKTNWAFSY